MSDHVDDTALQELKEVMEEDFALLVETYIADTDERVEALIEGVSEQDADSIRKVAHSIKGSSSNLFATQLPGLCQKMEDKGRDNSFAGMSTLLDEIKAEYQNVRNELSRLLA